MADLDQAVPMQSPMPILVCSSLLAMIHLTRKCTYHHRWTPMRNWVKLQVQISLKAKYNQYIDPYSLFFQAGLLNKLMHNMGSPFTNTVMPQQLMGDKISFSNTFSGPATFTSPKASDQPEVTLNQPTLISLKKCGIENGFQVAIMTPTWDAGHLLVVLSPVGSTEEAETKVGSHILLFQLNSGETGLVEQPVCQLSVDSMDGPRCVVMLPVGDRNDEPEWSAEEDAAVRGPMRAAVVTTDGRLRLLLMGPTSQLSWLDSVSSHKFVDVTYCSSVERICATTDKGELVFFKIIPHVSGISSSRLATSSRSGLKKGKEPSPTKLLIHQPLTSETLKSLYDLTLAEKLPQTCQLTITAASCWMELAVTQRQRRQPQPWLLQPGGCTAPNNAGGEDGLQMARLFKLQQDKFSWDEHFFEMSLPPGISVAHVHLRFVLLPSCSVPPEIQVGLNLTLSCFLYFDVVLFCWSGVTAGTAKPELAVGS